MNGRLTQLVLILVLFAAPLFGQTREAEQPVRPATQTEEVRSEAEMARLRVAASQHQIIGVLLDEGEFEAIPAEFGKILDLEFTGADEKLLIESLWGIVERLRKESAFAVAHQLVTEGLEATAEIESQFNLLMLRAKVFQDQRMFREAIGSLRQAQALQQDQETPQRQP